MNRYVATPGETVVLTVDWATAKGGCAGCVAPVAVGWAGNKLGCVYSGVPSTCTAAGGWATTGTNRNFTFTAPTAPGIYPLRWAISLVFNCDVNFANPSPFNTWGVLEVQ